MYDELYVSRGGLTLEEEEEELMEAPPTLRQLTLKQFLAAHARLQGQMKQAAAAAAAGGGGAGRGGRVPMRRPQSAY